MDSAARTHGFDFSAAMRQICVDMARRLPEFSHIDMGRVAVGFCQTRKNVSHGYQASLTPTRFEGGSRTAVCRGRRVTVEPSVDSEGREYLYLLNFYLPRFLNHSLEEKLATVVHEMWHISPAFDGDIRRHDGHCHVHGPSEREYDAVATHLAQSWLALDPPLHLYEFLGQTFTELAAEHGGVFGQKIRTPRLIPVATTPR